MEKKTDGKHLDYFIKVDGKYTPLSMVSGSVDQILDLEPMNLTQHPWRGLDSNGTSKLKW